MKKTKSLYHGHRFPAAVIRHGFAGQAHERESRAHFVESVIMH
ncbi:hypothetical protein [Paraburkholderia ferrariae]|jgi:hypothetical protein|nr:hypothetical protein [Paraburkholderia ferrariae]